MMCKLPIHVTTLTTLFSLMSTWFALAILAGPAMTPQSPSQDSKNSLVTALWFAHEFGKPEMLVPAHDRQLKHMLNHDLGSDARALSNKTASELFGDRVVQPSTKTGEALTVDQMISRLRETTPPSRGLMFAKVRQHADLLTTQFDLIEPQHHKAIDQLVDWLVARRQSHSPSTVIVICTGNSRRSILGATFGNIAASYYGLPEIRFFSGGTKPSAFNRRTIAALSAIGVEIDSQGSVPGAHQENLIFNVRWGQKQEVLEFSKLYSDTQNPRKDFAALLVCSDADQGCPVVAGAAVRIPAPYDDPRLYDGAAFEAAKYAERRDDIGRLMLNVMMQVRRRLNGNAAR